MVRTTGDEEDPYGPIAPKDLRVDTFRWKGQDEWPVRITHIPTGIQVTASEEATEVQNKAKALRLLREKLRGSSGEAQ